MSKLINHIEAHQTGRRFPKNVGPLKYSDLTEIEDISFEPFPHLIEYSIRVKIGACVRIDKNQPSGLESSTKTMIRAIEQEVFGEFREDIDKMYRALWECDIEKTKELLDSMRERMFSA